MNNNLIMTLGHVPIILFVTRKGFISNIRSLLKKTLRQGSFVSGYLNFSICLIVFGAFVQKICDAWWVLHFYEA